MVISLQPSHLKRYKDVVWLFVKYGRGDLVKSTGDEMLDDVKPLAPDQPIASADELATDLEKMGPTFVKIGQLLSTRPDLLPVAYIEALTRLQDKVEPFPFLEVEKIICSELGVRLSKAFGSIDHVPIAAASLGQVHRATMRDGREVAVKVQRPGIRERMVDDLDSLQEVAAFLDQHTEIGKRYELERTVVEFRKTLLQELDYRQEAQNLTTLGANLKEFQRIIVPQPINDYTTSRVLTMEFIGGFKVTKLSAVVWTEIDGDVLAEEVFKAYLKQVLIDGVFHADPHPGNVLLTEDSSIALLDLGMIARVSPRMQDGMLRVLLAISEGRGEDAAEGIIEIAEKKDGADEAIFRRAVDAQVSRYKEASLRQISAGKILMELCKTAADAGIRPPPEFTTLGKTLLNLDILGTTLSPNFNPNESIRRNAAEIVQRRLTGSLTMSNMYISMLEAKNFAQNLPGRINKILDNIAGNKLKIEVDAIDEDKLMVGFQKVANRITVGLVIAAMIVGAALLTQVDTPTKLFGYPALATVFFLLAATGGVILLIQILYYDEHKKYKR